jgi:hypothetical protein
MPDDTLEIRIARSDPNPNGAGAVMSITGNGHPSQATWRALDREYTITLPATVWESPSGAPLSFPIAQQQTSAVYKLKSGAPTGESGYEIDPPSPERVPPTIMIDP